jgi:septal ring factor EnvC (AmiA/AmiB activator)
MKTLVTAVLLIATLAAGGLAWQQHQLLRNARSELARTNDELQRTKDLIRAMDVTLAALRKEAAEQKMALDQLQADLNIARTNVETEKAVSARLRDENAKLKESVAVLARMRGRSEAPPALPSVAPSTAPPRPMLAPGGRGTAAGAPQRAQ